MIHLPLTDHANYNMYHILSLPAKMKDTDRKFTFIFPECEYLLIDVAKQYQARLKLDEIKECRLINSYNRVCK